MDPVTCCSGSGGFSAAAAAAGLPTSPFTMSCEGKDAAVSARTLTQVHGRGSAKTQPELPCLPYDLHDCSWRAGNWPFSPWAFHAWVWRLRGAQTRTTQQNVNLANCANRMLILTNSSWLNCHVQGLWFYGACRGSAGKACHQMNVIEGFFLSQCYHFIGTKQGKFEMCVYVCIVEVKKKKEKRQTTLRNKTSAA